MKKRYIGTARLLEFHNHLSLDPYFSFREFRTLQRIISKILIRFVFKDNSRYLFIANYISERVWKWTFVLDDKFTSQILNQNLKIISIWNSRQVIILLLSRNKKKKKNSIDSPWIHTIQMTLTVKELFNSLLMKNSRGRTFFQRLCRNQIYWKKKFWRWALIWEYTY